MNPIRLSQLEPHLVRWERRDGSEWNIPVTTIAEADGICFLCPLCLQANGMSKVGVHSVLCWTPRVPDEVQPGPGRWTLTGNTIEDLTVAEAPPRTRSILLLGGCGWHGFITDGLVT